MFGWIPMASSKKCRSLAFLAWAILVFGYAAGQFAFIGWVGPGPVFLLWTLVALPLLGVTAFWLRKQGTLVRRSLVLCLLALWILLGTLAVIDQDVGNLPFWFLSSVFLVFPVVVGFQVMKYIEATPDKSTA
jgi:hypothetical protein